MKLTFPEFRRFSFFSKPFSNPALELAYRPCERDAADRIAQFHVFSRILGWGEEVRRVNRRGVAARARDTRHNDPRHEVSPRSR